jgi:hypothetical protein
MARYEADELAALMHKRGGLGVPPIVGAQRPAGR